MALERVRKLNGLTALRFIAAAGVVVYHSEGYFGIPENWEGDRLPLGMGVSFFFVLSGFVLAYVYPVLEDWAKRRKFWKARIARVWPAHIGALLFLCALLRHARNFPMGYGSWWMAGINALMVQAWVPIPHFYFSYNSPAWSISTELGFYLLFPWLIWRWERTWWWKFAAALAVAGGLVCLCQSGIIENSSDPWKAQWVGVLVTNPVARLIEFMLGMLGALLYRKTRPHVKMGFVWGTFIEIAAIACMAYNFSHADAVLSLSGIPHMRALIFWMVHGPVCALTFFLIIYVLALEQGVVSRLLGMSAGVLLGEISFSVYLLHDVMLTYYAHHEAYFAWYPGWVIYAGFWAILLLTSWLMWAGFERPVRAWLVALPHRGKKEQPAAVSATGASAGMWGWVFTPSRRELERGVAALLILLAPVVVMREQPPMPSPTAAFEQQGPRFGKNFELVKASFTGAASEGPARRKLNLMWRCVAEAPRDYLVGIHFVDNQGKILAQSDIPQYANDAPAKAGDEWMNSVPLPADLPAGVTEVGVCLYKPGSVSATLAIDRGPRDWGNYRLLIPMR